MLFKKSGLSLTYYDPKKDIIVISDARNLGLGVTILHKESYGQVKAIAHALRTLLLAAKGFSQIEKGASGIIFAVKKFLIFIHGRNFTLQTDLLSLLSIFVIKKWIPIHPANLLQKWKTILLNNNFNMDFLPLKTLGHANGLSGLIPKPCEPLEETVIATLRLKI